MTPSVPFVFGSVTIPPGSIMSGQLDVPKQGTSPASFVPFSVLHGTSPGPVLALVAGVHGMEYVPILALQRLRRT